MPTYGKTGRFIKDHAALSPEDRKRFKLAVEKFVGDLKAKRPFREGLRVKGVRGAEGIFEMTWADDGRATFEYGEEHVEGEPHVIWRRVGTHDVFDSHRPIDESAKSTKGPSGSSETPASVPPSWTAL